MEEVGTSSSRSQRSSLTARLSAGAIRNSVGNSPMCEVADASACLRRLYRLVEEEVSGVPYRSGSRPCAWNCEWLGLSQLVCWCALGSQT